MTTKPEANGESWMPVGRRTALPWWLLLITGVLWLLLALAVLHADTTSVRLIAVFAGIFLLAAAVMELLELFAGMGWRWLHLVLAVLFLAGGIAALVWPGPTFLALARLFAWYLLIRGTFNLVMGLGLRRAYDLWWLELIVGVAEIGIAFWAVGYPGRSATLLILWIGIGALFRGVGEIIAAFVLHSATETFRPPPRRHPAM